MEILKENFLKLREKMMEKFKEDFARHRELGEKEVPIKTIGPINGVYYERGERSYFVRPRIRAGIITLQQLRAVSDLSLKHGDGEIKLTTRHGIQLRGIKADNVLPLIEDLFNVGLKTQAVGGKSIRGMIISSYSGFEEEEFDVTPYAVHSINYLFQNEDTYTLPGKLKFSASNSSEDTAGAKYADMGFIAKKINNEDYFEVYFDFGMNLSNKNPYKYSKDIKAEEMLYYMRAMVMMFKDNMEMTNPRARVRTMNRKIGIETFEETFKEYFEKAKKEVDSVIDIKELYKDVKTQEKVFEWSKEVDFVSEGIDEELLINVRESYRQKGIYAVKLKFAGGVIRRKQLEGILEYLESLNHEIKIKLTNNQEIIVFNLNGEETLHILENFEERLIRSAFEDTITCTGVPRCRLAITSSKSAFDKILKKFNNNDATLKKELPQLRISGCPNSCSLTFKGDLGFSGRIKKIDEKVNIAYTLLSENKNIELAGRAIILERDLPEMIYEMALLKKESQIKDFHEFVNTEHEKINELIRKYVQ